MLHHGNWINTMFDHLITVKYKYHGRKCFITVVKIYQGRKCHITVLKWYQGRKCKITVEKWYQGTGGPSSLHERGRDSCLRAVLCYKRLFTKACMGCKRFFLKGKKCYFFLNKIDLPYCLVVFFVVYPRLRPFRSVFGELALFWCSTAKRISFSSGRPKIGQGR